MKRNRDDGEEERGLLINVKVIEYLQPVMSKELLCKFPDNSAFDFDYSQSSIWSPLIPPTYTPMDFDHLITPRKLSNDFEFHKKNAHNKNRIFKFNLLKTTKKKTTTKIKSSEFSPNPVKNSCLPVASKGWAKVLKAASKHFKKKKKDGGMRVKFTSCRREASN